MRKWPAANRRARGQRATVAAFSLLCLLFLAGIALNVRGGRISRAGRRNCSKRHFQAGGTWLYDGEMLGTLSTMMWQSVDQFALAGGGRRVCYKSAAREDQGTRRGQDQQNQRSCSETCANGIHHSRRVPQAEAANCQDSHREQGT